MNKKITINSNGALSKTIGLLREKFKTDRYFQITIHSGKKRSLNQNALLHAWALQVSREEMEYPPEGVKSLWKLHWGLPILRGDDEEYNNACLVAIDPLPYESKIKAMAYWPCTSLMKTKQLNELLEQVQAHYVGRVLLEFPEA